MSKKLRIGIIGTGRIARAHARAYHNIPEVEVVAGADIIPGKAVAFLAANNFPNARAFDSHEALLEMDLDAVSICTYNTAHCKPSIDAMNSGKHVLLEKPMSVTLEEAVEMVKVSKKTGKILSVGFQPRYDANMKMIKEIVQSGTLGKIYYIQTGGGRRRGIPSGSFVEKRHAGMGALGDIGCYSLDMVLNAINYPKPLTVSAYASNYFGKNPKYFKQADVFDVDDFSAAFIRLEGGIVIDFKISWAMHMDTMGDTMFLGDQAGLKIKSPNLGKPFGGAWDGGVGPVFMYHDVGGRLVETPIPLVEGDSVERASIFEQKVRDFVLAVINNKKAPIPGEQILRNQAIIDGIIRSVECGKEVDIIIPDV